MDVGCFSLALRRLRGGIKGEGIRLLTSSPAFQVALSPLRISDFGFPLDFEFRISDFKRHGGRQGNFGLTNQQGLSLLYTPWVSRRFTVRVPM